MLITYSELSKFIHSVVSVCHVLISPGTVRNFYVFLYLSVKFSVISFFQIIPMVCAGLGALLFMGVSILHITLGFPTNPSSFIFFKIYECHVYNMVRDF